MTSPARRTTQAPAVGTVGAVQRWRLLTRELRRRPILADGLLAAVLTAIDLGWLVAQRSGRTVLIPGAGGLVVRHVALLPPLATLLLILETVPLVLRRRSPIVTLFVIGTARVAYDLLRYHDAPQPLGVLIALYTVAVLAEGRWRRTVPVTTAIGLALSMTTNRARDIPVQVALNGVLLGGAWILGDNARTRRAYVAEVEARVEQAELAHHAIAAQAALEERARIARELHDLVAHHLSVIAVQSEAAAALVPVDPERAATAIGSVRSTAIEALTEMRQLLGVLRRDRAAELSPQPGLADLDRLFAPLRDAGLPITHDVVGAARPLPAVLDLTCYRLVQEALTNTLKHADASAVCVRVDWRPDGVALEVADDGRGTPADRAGRDRSGAANPGGHGDGSSGANGEPAGDGQGLAGMRERVALVGGHVTATSRPDAGFVVSAWIPTP